MEETCPLAEWIIEQTADAVIYADSSGAIARWNHAAATLFGYSVAEALAGCGNTRSNHERLSSRRASWSRFFHHPGIDRPIPVSGG